MISGHATIEDAVAATRLGAFDFMEKPLDRNRVVVTARNALERRKMWKEVHDLRRAVDARGDDPHIVGGTLAGLLGLGGERPRPVGRGLSVVGDCHRRSRGVRARQGARAPTQ